MTTHKTLYDAIGKNYAQTRSTDSRIAETLIEILALPQKAKIADIGAGTGSYAQALAASGCRVVAIEPSATMRQQAITHPNIHWVNGCAENIAISDNSVDAAIIMLAFHHFRDPQQALKEMSRITRTGKVVIFTYDPKRIASFWLTEYFPSLVSDVENTFLSLTELVSELSSATKRPVRVAPFSLPSDLTDSFAAVGWARPELYLDETIRNGISSFSKITTSEIDRGLLALQTDLESGRWDDKHGYLREKAQHDVGYCFVYTP